MTLCILAILYHILDIYPRNYTIFCPLILEPVHPSYIIPHIGHRFKVFYHLLITLPQASMLMLPNWNVFKRSFYLSTKSAASRLCKHGRTVYPTIIGPLQYLSGCETSFFIRNNILWDNMTVDKVFHKSIMDGSLRVKETIKLSRF